MIAQGIIAEKIHFKKNASSGQKHSRQAYKVIGQGKAGRQERPAGSGWPRRSKDVPALTANIFEAVTNRTNIRNKTWGTCH